jgi:hypothetical protein
MTDHCRKRTSDGNIKPRKESNADAHREAIQLPRQLSMTGQTPDVAADTLERRIAASDASKGALKSTDVAALIQVNGSTNSKHICSSSGGAREATKVSCPVNINSKDAIIR